ncbi:MAG TPA: LssY C-terminal domain-containing protein [Candidatus Acidoferrales bacterium]|nr:LssY C-terminal domain-containing protein [Candidatus Acidoferrales bacterium]
MRSTTAMTVMLTAAAICAMPAARAQSAQTSAPAAAAVAASKSYELDIDGTKQWIDTNIDLRAGEKLHITGTGTITYAASDPSKSKPRTTGPDGLARGWADLIHPYAVADGGHSALIGRLGAGDGGQPFLVGAAGDYQAPVAGRLFLGINQSLKDAGTATGSFHVKIEVTDAGLNTAAAASAGGPAETAITSITPALLEEIPRRVNDPQGNPGDMVNILIVGTQDQVVQVFTAAGWVQVDKSVQDTLVTGLVASFEKKDYLTMPMSTLYLFGRAQDYGFAHAEPVKVAMSRNHLRVWKSPYTAGGQPVWCVAATHDIGFERDQRNNGLTHKIDPAIDGEREYVNDTLSSTGLVVEREHVTPASPLTEAKTATGGSFHSDGRILVLVLKAGTTSSSN